jgi:hypothetical protein
VGRRQFLLVAADSAKDIGAFLAQLRAGSGGGSTGNSSGVASELLRPPPAI